MKPSQLKKIQNRFPDSDILKKSIIIQDDKGNIKLAVKLNDTVREFEDAKNLEITVSKYERFKKFNK